MSNTPLFTVSTASKVTKAVLKDIETTQEIIALVRAVDVENSTPADQEIYEEILDYCEAKTVINNKLNASLEAYVSKIKK